jgi:hypothetical protein
VIAQDKTGACPLLALTGRANPQFRADKQPSWRFMLPDPPRLTTPDFVGDDFIEGMLE